MTTSEWEDLDARALSTIRLCLADEVLFNIVEETAASGLWEKLENLYMTKSLTNIIYLKRQLYSLRMKEGSNVAEHLNVFNTLICQLTDMKVKIQEEDKAITLLCSLPESWDHFVTSVSLSTTDSLKFESVVGALLSEEVQRKSSTETAASEAMVARGHSKERGEKPRGSSRSKSKGNKCKAKCWNCNKVGHLKKDCWKRKESENLKNEANQVDSVFKGALVVMKAEKVGNLYRLKGSTQISEAAVALEKEEAGTRLWHQRLGHMSEKGLQILMKRKSLPGEFEQYCKDEGIFRPKTAVYTPQQNGVAERMNRTLMERARSLINNANLQKELWAEAVSTACYLVNRSPLVAIDCKIPEEVWTGQSCDYSHLRIFGCDAYSLIPKNQRSKLDPKSKCYVFVGYDYAVKGYRLWDSTLRKIVISRDVTFDESSLLKSTVERIEQE
eukprot:PITA_16747